MTTQPLEAPEFHERCTRYWRQQRVAPLLARIVSREPAFPAEWKRWAGETLGSNAVLSLQHLERTASLVRLLSAEAGIDAMPLKGVTLSLLLYGDPGFRQCGDIDLMVPEHRFDEAVGLLQESHGYQRSIPTWFTADGRLKPSHRRFRNEVGLVSASGDHVLEVHYRMSKQMGLLPERFDQVRAAAIAVEAGGMTLYTPGPEHLLAFLAVHAMFSRWSAMKWLYDLPMVVERFGADAVDHAYHHAGLGGFTPLLDAALTLGARLIGRDPPVCQGSPAQCAELVDAVWRRLGDGSYAVENRRDPIRLALFRMKLLSGFRARAELAAFNLLTLIH